MDNPAEEAPVHQTKIKAAKQSIPSSSAATSVNDTISDSSELSSNSKSSCQNSAASSQRSTHREEDTKDVAMELAAIFYQDADLIPLYSKGIASRKRKEFLRIHNSLLENFSNNLRLETNCKNPPYITRVLESKYHQRKITSTVWDFFKRKDARRKRINERIRQMRPHSQDSISNSSEGQAISHAIRLGNEPDNFQYDSGDESDGEYKESDEDVDNEEHETSDLQCLESAIATFTQQLAFRAFKRSIEYLANPPSTLDIALESRNVRVVEYYLRRNSEQTVQREDASPWVQELNKLCLPKKAIAELLLENIDESTGILLSYDLGLEKRLDHFANQLGNIYSQTDDIDSLEGAIKPAKTSTQVTHKHVGRSQWLSDLGIPLNNRPRTIITSKNARTKAAIFQWDIPSLFLEQDGGAAYVEDLDHQIRTFIVLTGSDGVFEASACAKYLEQTFGSVGSEVLSAVVEALEYFMFSNLPANERARFKHVGAQSRNGTKAVKVERISWHSITMTTRESEFPPGFIESMTWLCASMRIVPLASAQNLEEGCRLFKSSMSLWSKLGASSVGSAPITLYTLEPLQQLTDEEIGKTNCWTKLFKSAVISWKEMEHQGGVGVKVDYDLLVHLSAVTNYAYVEDPSSSSRGKGLVAFGFYTALIPTARVPAINGIQWHLEVTRDRIIDPQKLETIQGEWLPISEPREFSKSVCFLR